MVIFMFDISHALCTGTDIFGIVTSSQNKSTLWKCILIGPSTWIMKVIHVFIVIHIYGHQNDMQGFELTQMIWFGPWSWIMNSKTCLPYKHKAHPCSGPAIHIRIWQKSVMLHFILIWFDSANEAYKSYYGCFFVCFWLGPYILCLMNGPSHSP